MSVPQRLTVIVPVYRPGPFLEEAIASVLSQRLPPDLELELVVVFDGPDPENETLLWQLCPKARILTHPENRGPSAARNTGLEAATGDFISFIDADDVWAPNRLLRDWELFAEKHLGVYPDAIMSYQQTIREGKGGRWLHAPPSWIFLTGVGTYRREVFEQIGGFDESLRYGEDSDWFFRFWEENGNFRIRHEVGLLYRVHEGGMTWQRSIAEKGHIKAIKKSLDRRRSGRGKAPDLKSPHPNLPMAERCTDPDLAVSVLRSCLKERWRYFGAPLPISLISGFSQGEETLGREWCRDLVLMDQEDKVPFAKAVTKCQEEFTAVEMPGSQPHPLRYAEQIALFDLFPQIDVVISKHLVCDAENWREVGAPEISSFLARTEFMQQFPQDKDVMDAPVQVMFRVFCEWKKKGAEIMFLPWPLNAIDSEA